MILLALTLVLAPERSLCADEESAARGAMLIDQDIRQASLDADLSMVFRGATADECRTWQTTFRDKLAELLGDVTPPDTWTVLEQQRTELDDHTRYELLLQAKDVASVPLYVLVPRGVSPSNPAPAVLCLHGHGPFGHDPVVGRRDVKGIVEATAHVNYDYGLKFVQRGFVVAAPCMIPFGRRVDRERYGGSDPCAVAFVRMQALGQLPIAANLRDLKWTLDYLQQRADVLPDRLGCAGLSYGGRMTMLLTATDPRIKVAAVSGALNLLQERITSRYSCGSQVIPGLLHHGDFSEIGSLIAPRPCVWEVGSDDPLIIADWDRLFRQRLSKAYAALGAPDQLHFDDFQGAHRWNGAIAFPLFNEILQP